MVWFVGKGQIKKRKMAGGRRRNFACQVQTEEENTQLEMLRLYAFEEDMSM